MFWGVDFPKFFEVLEVRSRILKGEPLPTKVRELVLWNHGFLWFSNDCFPRKFPYIWYMVKYPIFIICGYIPKFYDFPIILGIHILGIINMTNINIKHPKYPTDWYFFHFMTFLSYWEYHHPNWRTPSFFRGVETTTNQIFLVPGGFLLRFWNRMMICNSNLGFWC